MSGTQLHFELLCSFWMESVGGRVHPSPLHHEISSQILQRTISQGHEGCHGRSGVLARQERGWKLFVLLPRLLLFKNARGATLGKEKFAKRFDMFVDGEWAELFRTSRKCAEDMANVNRRRQRRGLTDPDAKRLEKAMILVQLGEFSSARQALEGAELAPGTQTT